MKTIFVVVLLVGWVGVGRCQNEAPVDGNAPADDGSAAGPKPACSCILPIVMLPGGCSGGIGSGIGGGNGGLIGGLIGGGNGGLIGGGILNNNNLSLTLLNILRNPGLMNILSGNPGLINSLLVNILGGNSGVMTTGAVPVTSSTVPVTGGTGMVTDILRGSLPGTVMSSAGTGAAITSNNNLLSALFGLVDGNSVLNNVNVLSNDYTNI